MALTALHALCTVIGVICSTYLALRLAGLLLRVRRARRAYPALSTPTRADQRRCPAGLLQQPPSRASSHDANAWQDRCRGALVGLAIGDALGLPAESLPPWLVRLRYPAGPAMRRGLLRLTRRAGDVSDDTQLAICVARSVDPSGAYLHDRFCDELRIWRGYRVGAGRACSVAARRLARARTVELAEVAAALPSEGNGAAMRVAPLALAHPGAAAASERLAAVMRNARATHDTEIAVNAAVLVAELVALALRWPPAQLNAQELRIALPRLAGVDERFLAPALQAARGSAPLAERLQRLGTSGHAAQTLPAAILLLLEHPLDLPGAMAAIFSAGGDVDSIAAIVGAVIGAQRGLSGLPASWANAVQHRATLVHLADKLAATAGAAARSPLRGELVELRGDVATRPVDAIVNAWNRNVIPAWLLLPQGVSRSIRRAGGRAAIREIARRGPLPLGSAAETLPGGLRARWVIHVAGIDLLWRSSERALRLSVRNALSLARCLGARSVALPLIGAGSGGMARERARALIRGELAPQRQHFDRLELVGPER